MIAWRTRHDLSSASSTMAGRRLSDKSSMPMTEGRYQICAAIGKIRANTCIDGLKLADDVQPDFWELIFEQV